MELFTCAGANAVETDSIVPRIATPLGIIGLGATVDGINLADMRPGATYRLPNGAHLFSWQAEAFTAELLLCRPNYKPAFRNRWPDDWRVTDCWAGLWRLKAGAQFSPAFCAYWEPGYSWRDRDTAHGEDLIAQEWTDLRFPNAFEDAELETPEKVGFEVYVGTEDKDAMQWRVQRGVQMPARWMPCFHAEASVSYDNESITASLPELNDGEECQIQFLVAWEPFSLKSRDAWLVVDLPWDLIVRSAGCEE